ncbi:hypothetical protein [Ruminococcus albus]|uniref:Uncharacterized protein n=1 Tax=Ruminococcus albus (strain ATCC 27210 / DSM 20455 / JCM 14654 / NCDO 2250 / 7) TaxID=697329 RepID=E6UJB6_RUMA7|nr:hypothetical protein [Ruminococcus albus]ADU23762.1 hypothetical protein Rumal_3299 [Ruminococcus albus 7 = DSM 20455]
MKDYAKRFFNEEEGEEGAEFLEYAVIIGLSAILIAVIIVVVMVVKYKGLKSAKKIDEAGNDSTAVDWDAALGDKDKEVNDALKNLD